MKISYCKIVLAIFLLASLSSQLHADKRKDSATFQHGESRQQLLNIMGKAIDLNEDFKRSVNRVAFDEHIKRKELLEKYHEEELGPAIDRVVEILSSKSDLKLICKYYDLLISFENSADESLSYALGIIFLNNPALIEQTIKGLDNGDRKYILGQLDFGWQNVLVSKKSDNRIRERQKRFDKLRFSINGAPRR